MDLLYKGDIGRISQTETCRACDAYSKFSLRIVSLYYLQLIRYSFLYL